MHTSYEQTNLINTLNVLRHDIPNKAIAKFDKSANVVDGGIDIASVLDVTGWNSVMLISLICLCFDCLLYLCSVCCV